jgi:glycine cleavage system H protein
MGVSLYAPARDARFFPDIVLSDPRRIWFCGRVMTDRKRPRSLRYRRCRFVAALPLDYLYSPSHFWLARREDGTWRVGMTKFATRMLGETVELGFNLEPQTRVVRGQALGWVEGFKSVSDLGCVVEGTFLGGNPALQTDIALVNKDPHGAGWLYAMAGEPDPDCVRAKGYARVLDAAIDRLREAQTDSPSSTAG